MACRSMVCIYFSVPASFYRQGLSLVCRCFQLTEAWLLAAGTPLLQGRPGYGNHPAIGPAAQGGAWCGGRTRRHSKGNGPNLDLTQAQPRTPGRSLGGNALSGFWFLLPAQKKPPAGSVPTKPEGLKREKRRWKWPVSDYFHLFQAIAFETGPQWFGRTAARR